jgi:hypothetical protein
MDLGEHVTVGKAEVADSDYNGAFRAALQRAMIQAVRDESFKILPSVLILKYRPIIKDEIWNNPAPFVLKYRVLSMGMQGEQYLVKIDASIERDFLKRRLWELVSTR